jgi:hypothetical protein
MEAEKIKLTLLDVADIARTITENAEAMLHIEAQIEGFKIALKMPNASSRKELQLCREGVEALQRQYNTYWLRIQRLANRLNELPIYITDKTINLLSEKINCLDCGYEIEANQDNYTIYADVKASAEYEVEKDTGAAVFTEVNIDVNIHSYYNGNALNIINKHEAENEIVKQVINSLDRK